MNIIAISGNLTRSPELKMTATNLQVSSFIVAVRRPGCKDKTDFIRCVAWRAKAEFVSKYFKKGDRIEVAGALTARRYEDSSGNTHEVAEIACTDISFGGSNKKDDQSGAAEEEKSGSCTGEEDFTEITTEDDLPF